MPKTMKAAVMNGIGEIGYVEKEIMAVKPDEVLVKLEYIGICGSDIHYYESGRIGDYIVKPPFVLGHECSGTVAEKGSLVTHLEIGDRVALEPGKTCGSCCFCREGKYNLCSDVIFFATPPVDGVFQEYIAHEAALCFKLPDNLSTLEGALIEPLAIGFHAAIKGQAMVGKTAAVIGAGCIGLVSLLALNACGVSQVFVADLLDKRLDKARELGASDVINSKENDVAKKILELTGGLGCDLVIECSGAEAAAAQAVAMTRKGATIVMVGYSKTGMVNFPMAQAMNKELRIETVFRYRHMYPLAIKAVAAGKVNLKGLVTDYFAFDDLQNAMDRSVADKENIVKAVVRV
ncbi:MAG: NAD(P)-dependent alcohol dehydrogenase [Lachnospiraceae bacterium]|nr:NAD(P)-dependent alcohol dehydrogenase [Lachnospiraceae bacterium]